MAIETVSESFMARVLREFGLQWAHLAVFSGIAFSAFGLDKYFNAGAWMVVAVTCFCIVYLFRRSISPKFAMVGLWSFAFCAVFLGSTSFLIDKIYDAGLVEFMVANKILATSIFAGGIIIPLAIMLVSYKAQEDDFGDAYPEEITAAIRKNLVDLPFYKQSQEYRFEVVARSEEATKVRLTLSYVLVNRSGRTQQAHLTLAPLRERTRFVEATVGTAKLDVHDPAHLNEAGLSIRWPIEPGQMLPVRLEALVNYRSQDSDLMASYMPTTSFSLTVINSFEDLRITVESLFREHIVPQIDGAERRYVSTGGTLPYQGFKMDWTPTVPDEQ